MFSKCRHDCFLVFELLNSHLGQPAGAQSLQKRQAEVSRAGPNGGSKATNLNPVAIQVFLESGPARKLVCWLDNHDFRSYLYCGKPIDSTQSAH